MASVRVRRPESEQELAGLKALRQEVFVHEQGVPRELELDALDETAIHAVAKDGDDVVGTGRLLVDTPGQAHIGQTALFFQPAGFREAAPKIFPRIPERWCNPSKTAPAFAAGWNRPVTG